VHRGNCGIGFSKRRVRVRRDGQPVSKDSRLESQCLLSSVSHICAQLHSFTFQVVRLRRAFHPVAD